MIDASGGNRLLMLAPVMPSDRGNGLAMRAGLFLDAYARRFIVDLVVAPVAGKGGVTAFARARARRIDILELGAPDTHYGLLTAIGDPDARLEAFRRYARPTLTAHLGPLRGALEAYAVDVSYAAIHVFRLYLAELASPWSAPRRNGTRLILDCDEDDAATFRRIAAMERRRGDPRAAGWAEAEADAFARLAQERLSDFDVVLAASPSEARSLASGGVRVSVVPNLVISLPARKPPRRHRRPTILFVGTLGYVPNTDAVMWFAARVWPRLWRRLHGRVRFVVVGSSPPAAVARLRGRTGIEITGDVADVAASYRGADIAIVPLRAGGGTRIKMVEAAAYGVPVVSTRLGAEGMSFQPQVDMLVADGADGLLQACVRLLSEGATRRRLAEQGRARVRRDYSGEVWKARIVRLAGASEDRPAT